MSDLGAIILLVGRILFAIQFAIVAGIFHLTKGPMAVGFARQMGFPFPFLASWVTGIWLVAGGVSVGLGIWPDAGALLLGAFVVPAALWFHRFWQVEDASQQMTQMQLWWRNVSYLGAALMLFAFFAAFGHDLAYTITDPVFDLRP